MSLVYYKDARTIHPIKFSIGMLLAFTINLILTAFAALLGLWLGRPYVGIFLVALFAFLSSYVYRYTLKVTKTRSKAISHLVILLFSLIIAYYHMVVVTSAVATIGPAVGIPDPSVYTENLRTILITNCFNRTHGEGFFFRPVHVLGSFFSSGIPWIIYLFIIIASNVILSQLAVNITTRPFSEKYNDWMTKVYTVARVQYFLPEEKSFLLNALEKGNVDVISQRQRVTRYNAERYAKPFFYKVGNSHSGYVGLDNFVHPRTESNELIIDTHDIENYLPPVYLGSEECYEIENSLNTSAILTFGLEDSIPNTTFKKTDTSDK